ncbi:ATP-binding protein [Mycobacterium hubeiense]|uniref:ATP-binding protein n=1 Tax=Mycobacterium hubeiense TaxID=1867256 RepID=UPI000C7ECABB|nr:ATP-binding protein [Mycobacterium sp. QGD 101]
MPVEWVTAPQEPTLELLTAGVREGVGAVLIGPAGVGKTSLARLAFDRLRPEFGRAGWVTGTASSAAVPFGAFVDLVDVPVAGKTAAVLRVAREAMAGMLLVVDDAHLLDTLSATLVYQLAVGGNCRLIVTVGSEGPVPEAISSLWRNDVLARVDVEPPGHEVSRLATQASEYIDELPASVRRALQYLAVADPLSRADLDALAGHEAVEQAVVSGVITVDGSVARCAHPLYGEAIRDALGGPELRRLRTEVVTQLPEPRGVVSWLRLAVLALDSDAPRPVDEVVAAAEEALRLGDLELSERLGHSAVQRGAGLRARLVLGYALAWQGRGREADAVLDEVDPAGLSEVELMQWALPRAANQFWMRSEPERASAFLRTMRGRVSSLAARTTLDALSATFAMNTGSPRRAMEIAEDVLASPAADDTAIGWAAAAAALSCARMGRFAEVDALADRAMEAHHPGLLRFTSGFGQTTTLLLSGELDRAEALARQLTEFAQFQQPGRAIGDVLLADVLIARGELDQAVALLREAAATLAPTGYSWGPLASMLLAQALGQQCVPVEAGKALSRAESRHGLKSMLFAPELALARAWTLAARRDSVGAVAAAREAARAAERGGQSAVALRALHDAVRLGDARAGDAIARLGVECAFGRLALDHARALGDASALEEVSSRFAALGMRGAAADAAAQAASAKGLITPDIRE